MSNTRPAYSTEPRLVAWSMEEALFLCLQGHRLLDVVVKQRGAVVVYVFEQSAHAQADLDRWRLERKHLQALKARALGKTS